MCQKPLYYYSTLIKTGQFNKNKLTSHLTNNYPFLLIIIQSYPILLILLNTDFTYKMILKKEKIFLLPL